MVVTVRRRDLVRPCARRRVIPRTEVAFAAYRPALQFRSHVVRRLPFRRAELSDQLDHAGSGPNPSAAKTRALNALR